jgi:hypothetical protein
MASCALTVVGAAAGCGSDTSPGSATPTGSVAVGRVLSQRELDQLAVEKADLAGFDISALEGMGLPAEPREVAQRPRITPDECQAVYDMTGGGSGYQPVGRVVQSVDDASAKHLQGVTVTLSSYQPGDAPKAVEDLRGSVGDCEKFTAPPDAGTAYTYTDVEALPDPQLGDEALSYRVSQNIPADDTGDALAIQFAYVVVRTGPTVTTFAASPFKPGISAEVPQAVITAQLAKLT